MERSEVSTRLQTDQHYVDFSALETLIHLIKIGKEHDHRIELASELLQDPRFLLEALIVVMVSEIEE